MNESEVREQVREALGALLDDGEMLVTWHVTMEVVGPNDSHYLAHRAGSGGGEMPSVWNVVGMLEAGLMFARDQLRDCTVNLDDEDDDEGVDVDT